LYEVIGNLYVLIK